AAEDAGVRSAYFLPRASYQRARMPSRAGVRVASAAVDSEPALPVVMNVLCVGSTCHMPPAHMRLRSSENGVCSPPDAIGTQGPPAENRGGWGSLSRGGAKVSQPPHRNPNNKVIICDRRSA